MFEVEYDLVARLKKKGAVKDGQIVAVRGLAVLYIGTNRQAAVKICMQSSEPALLCKIGYDDDPQNLPAVECFQTLKSTNDSPPDTCLHFSLGVNNGPHRDYILDTGAHSTLVRFSGQRTFLKIACN
jgi:hypothetical protein